MALYPRVSTPAHPLTGVFEGRIIDVLGPGQVTIKLAVVNSAVTYTARCARGIYTSDAYTQPAAVDGVEHRHRSGEDLKAGDPVLVAFAHGRGSNPVVIAAL